MNQLIRVKQIADRHRLTFAIVLVIAIACVMTSISLSLYASSGTLQLDLSRPGYESVRKEIINPDNKTDFASSGPINKQSLDEYQKLLDARRKDLNALSNFKDKGLDDQSLILPSDTDSN